MSADQLDDGGKREGYDNPEVAVRERDLHAVLQRADARMMVFIAIGLAAAYLPEYVRMPAVAAALLRGCSMLCIIGGIGFTIYSAVVGQRRVANRYGVVCRACGFRPKADDIVHASDMGVCPRCGAALDVRRI